MEDLALDRSRNISFIVIGEKAKYLSAYTSIFIFRFERMRKFSIDCFYVLPKCEGKGEGVK